MNREQFYALMSGDGTLDYELLHPVRNSHSSSESKRGLPAALKTLAH